MSEIEIRIRNADEKDIPGIIELWTEHLDYHAKCDPFFERTEGAVTGFQEYLIENLVNIGLFIAENDIRIVGFILLEIAKRPPCFVHRNYGMISDIAVTNEFRHKKIGQQLLEYSLSWFKQRDINRIEAHILDANPLATAFWRSTGFKSYMNCAYLQIPSE